MRYILVIGLFWICSFQYSQAQWNDIEGGGFGNSATASLKAADKLYNDLEYNKAIPYFQAYLKKHGDDAAAWAKLGDCYRLNSDFVKAAEAYGKATKGTNQRPDAYLKYAQMLQAIGKYNEASAIFTQLAQNDSTNLIAVNQQQACDNYPKFLIDKARYDIKNLAFNTPQYDFSPAIYKDGLVYASSRDVSKPVSRTHTWTGTQFFDLYYVKGNKTEFKSKPEQIKKDGSTKFHEGVVAIRPDGKIYFTRNDFINGKTQKSSDKVIKQKMYISDLNNLKMQNDVEFAFDNKEYDLGQPAITADGNTMYFVSDMPNGFGGKDIYYTTLDNGKWVEPTNLGPEINTPGDEMFPTIGPDGSTLYFSSNGHPGMGALDIFKTKKLGDGTWTTPKNIGAPINSSYDDFGLIYADDKYTGYFTSNRPDGHGLDDIYSFTDNGIELEGVVVDSLTGKPICNSTVQMTNDGNTLGSKKTICDGYFEFSVLRDMDYCFPAKAEGYYPNNSICATTKGVKPGEKVFVRIPLLPERPASLTVQVIDKQTKKPIPHAGILLSAKCDGTIQNDTANENGKQCFKVKCDCDYVAVGNAEGYLPNQSFYTAKDKCDKLKECDKPNGEMVIVELDKLRQPEQQPKEPEVVLPKGYTVDSAGYIELKDIYYDFDKWYIRKESETELYKLLAFLIFNPDAIVEIASHTDARAPFDYNIKLSQRRAQSVVNWLAAKGIDRDRMKPVGYGETRLRNKCADGVPCTEEEHQRNRRTEFKVIGKKINLSSEEKKGVKVDPCLKCPF